MADFKLKDGQEVNFDLEALTWFEYEEFRRGALSTEQDAELLARVSGLSLDVIKALSIVQYKRLLKALMKKSSAPVDDPN
jgi:hypothetical protein